MRKKTDILMHQTNCKLSTSRRLDISPMPADRLVHQAFDRRASTWQAFLRRPNKDKWISSALR